MWFSTLGCVNFQSKSTKNIAKKKPTVVYSQQQRFLAIANMNLLAQQFSMFDFLVFFFFVFTAFEFF